MLYFINFGMPDYKSGIEHAELKRLRLFEEHHYPCKIIIHDWSRVLHKTAANAGVDDRHLLSMFDYFQGVENISKKRVTVNDLDLGITNVNRIKDEANQRYLVSRPDGRLLARVNYDQQDGEQVTTVELFDGYGNLYRVDNYDSRGFKSLLQWYSPDNKIDNEEWVTPDGQVVVRAIHKYNAQGKLTVTGWWLRDRQQVVHQFATMDQLFAYFLNVINESGQNIFILDRSLLADDALIHLDRPAYTVMHLHNSQAGNTQDPLHSILNDNYEYALVNINKYSAYICATARQTRDVIARFHPTCDMYTIPVGIVSEKQLSAPRIPESQRIFGKIIAVARIAREKNLGDLVKAVKIAHDQVPEVTLDLYGYPDSANNYGEKRKLTKLIQKLGLKGVVTFKGYTNDVGAIENSAQIFGLTSTMEGFNLAIMEAISHGVVGVTYDVNYGPNDIIQDGQNGYVVNYGDYQALGQRIIDLLQNPALMQTMSDGAYESARRYSPDNVWQGWEKLITTAKKRLKGEE